jgi:hypothetical protein
MQRRRGNYPRRIATKGVVDDMCLNGSPDTQRNINRAVERLAFWNKISISLPQDEN